MEIKTLMKTITFVYKKRKIHIVRADLALYQRDEDGRELWWFGSDPPEGIPSPKEVVSAIQERHLRDFPPPWAVILRGKIEEGAWICTDTIGLQHLFLRHIGDDDVVVGADALAVASFASVHIDPIGAYELMARGNPQGGRTLFTEVECISPSTLIPLDSNLKKIVYWFPKDPSYTNHRNAVDIYTNAVKKAVVRHWRDCDVQELTAGRDSLLVLSALLSEDIPVRTWTHGCSGDPDMIGAKRRSSQLGVPHQAIFLDRLKDIDPDEGMSLAKKYLRASGGMVNMLQYWHLPWVLDQLDSKGSITGVGGEVFRGFYYEWIGNGKIPISIGKWFLLHGKIREMMPFANPIILTEIAKAGDKVIREELKTFLSQAPFYWHRLDIYYLLHRMHHFAGTTFSAVGRWRTVRMPLFDPSVIDCLSIIPIELRQWSSGLAEEATRQFLKNKPFENESSYSYESLNYRIVKLLKRIKQLRGTYFSGYMENLARLILNSKEVDSLLNIDEMVTGNLYNKKIFNRYVNKIKQDDFIPLLIGSILTIELAAREVGSIYSSIDKIS
ncbi:Mu-like prophage FluMu protein gp28 [Candidatus Scalindua japonica]|uniref:Mu-like prophage FluMu protein gp28 n=1 Tax=Candidatus Scalindua japonica TaxID=1284222 RepID=A0A286TZ87_9BACT|nr:hypothetical protein [Candidatus Scalindua japonica]GAX61229.1 Mu-like prophage FluMu protein gp28 [Candidatus Scalindua japonica]